MDVLFTIALDKSFSVVVQEDYIVMSLVYSCFAALALHVGIFILHPREIKINFSSIKYLEIAVEKIPGKSFTTLLKIICSLLLFFCYLESLEHIRKYGRIEFNNLNLFWYSALIPLLGIFYSYIIALDYSKYRDLSLGTIISLYAYAFLSGYAGARRNSFIIVMFLAVIFFIRKFVAKREGNKLLLFNIFSIILLINFLAFSRAFTVGWSVLSEIESFTISTFIDLLHVTLSPMPTLHVNTLMLEFIEINGNQGFSSYLTSFLNTLFPRFIFGDYLFGTPLSMKLHDEFGWYGLDFGFMAEAIYAGGFYGNFILHFLFGLLIGFVARFAKRGNLFFMILMFGIIFGLSQSLRSDSMNLLKTTIYPAVFLYLFTILLKPRLSIREKNIN